MPRPSSSASPERRGPTLNNYFTDGSSVVPGPTSTYMASKQQAPPLYQRTSASGSVGGNASPDFSILPCPNARQRFGGGGDRPSTTLAPATRFQAAAQHQRDFRPYSAFVPTRTGPPPRSPGIQLPTGDACPAAAKLCPPASGPTFSHPTLTASYKHSLFSLMQHCCSLPQYSQSPLATAR